MAKKRKTREQKRLADLRHAFTHPLVNQPTPFEAKIQLQPKAKIQSIQTIQNPPAIISLTSYPFLVKDLSRTAMLTLTILALQIILFFLLTHHIFTIPNLSY